MCHACRLRKAQRFHTVELGGVPQAHFVQRGKAVGQVVAFCQQVKIHCKVPTFTTAPCCSPDIFGSVCSSGLWAVGPGGERRRCQHRVH